LAIFLQPGLTYAQSSVIVFYFYFCFLVSVFFLDVLWRGAKYSVKGRERSRITDFMLSMQILHVLCANYPLVQNTMHLRLLFPLYTAKKTTHGQTRDIAILPRNKNEFILVLPPWYQKASRTTQAYGRTPDVETDYPAGALPVTSLRKTFKNKQQQSIRRHKEQAL
jgi:hypothetical protein